MKMKKKKKKKKCYADDDGGSILKMTGLGESYLTYLLDNNGILVDSVKG